MTFINSCLWILFFLGSTICNPRYKIRVSKNCDKTETGIFRKSGSSLDDCVYECSVRSSCDGLRYFRAHMLCVLRDNTTNQGKSLIGTEPCVDMERQDILIPWPCVCSDNKVCEQNGNRARCVVKECRPINAVSYGDVNGNLIAIGSKLSYICNANYILNHDDGTMTCLVAGLWDKVPACIAACGEPSVGAHVQVSAGYSTGGSNRTYTCDKGYFYKQGRALLSTVVTQCLQNGAYWSLDGISCVGGKHIGDDCLSTAHCINNHSVCIESTCFCHPLYKYDKDVGDCVQRCSVVEDSFDVYNRTVFYSYNDWYVHKTVIQDCFDRCLTLPDCFHIEEWSGHCNLGKVNYATLNETKPEDIDTSYSTIYSRRCT